MSCDDISRYSVSSQSGSKGSEAVSYYLDQDSGQYFSLLEGDGPPGPDYDRGRNTGVRRRDKTPTHGKRSSVTRQLGWSRNGSGSVFVMEKKIMLSPTSSLTFSFHHALRAPPYMFVHHPLHGSAPLCHFPADTCAKSKTKSHAKQSIQINCLQLPVCPTTCVHPRSRSLPKLPVMHPSSEFIQAQLYGMQDEGH